MNENLTLDDLVKLSGLNIRTIRYYIQEGLLWGPDTKGKFATYSPEHLERLELIENLAKRSHLPLKEIRKLLDQTTPEQLQQIRHILASAAGQVVIIDTDQEPNQPGDAGAAALEYLDNINWVKSGVQEETGGYPADAIMNQNRTSPFTGEIPARSKGREENWQRITLDEGVELHIRAPRDRRSDSKVKELLEFARKLFRNL